MENDKLIETLKRVPNIPQNLRGVKYETECTFGGTLTAVRSAYNGHLHVCCDKCGVKIIE